MSKPPPSAPAPALAAALASPSPKKKPRGRPGSPVRLARAEADSVTALVKENKKLAAELRQLHQWREAVGGSFKLAWQHERAAHQRDLEASAVAKREAEEAQRKLTADLETSRAGARAAEARARGGRLRARRAAGSAQARPAEACTRARPSRPARVQASAGRA